METAIKNTKFSILVVEDEAIVALSLKQALQKMGYLVPAIAVSGESAIEQAAMLQPDLVLMDIRLQGELDGVSAAERIVARANIPIVYLTAYADEQLWERARNTNPFGYIVKPFQIRDLKTTVDIALRQHQRSLTLCNALVAARTKDRSNLFEDRCRESIVENVPGGILLYDRDRRLVLANPLGQQYQQQLQPDSQISESSEQFGDRSLAEILSPSATEERVWEIVATGESERIFEAIAIAIAIEGTLEGWLLWICDVTQRKQLQNELYNSLAQERELSQLRAESISIVSHEYRTPLTTILSSTELLEYYSDRISDEKKLQHLNRIKISVKRMTQLLDDILILNKAEAGQLKLKPTWLELDKFCRELVEEISLPLEDKYTIIFNSVGQSINAYLDSNLLFQVLNNLLSNAIKYSPEGSRIELQLIRENGFGIFQISDRGIGIASEDMKRLFQPFQRGVNVSNVSGTGLGLSIVKKAVELQGGQITVQSELGEGTTFTIKLPLSSHPN